MGLASRKLSDLDMYRESYVIGVGMLVSGALLSSIRKSRDSRSKTPGYALVDIRQIAASRLFHLAITRI